MRAIFAFLLMSFVLRTPCFSETLEFRKHGKTLRSLSLSEMKQKSAPVRVTVLEKHEGKKVTYGALPLVPLLKFVFGPDWDKTEEMLFVCRDGYKDPVSTERIKKYHSLLAFERAGGPFTLINRFQKDEKVDLSPFYLIWDNLKNKTLREEGPKAIPYQVIAIDLVDFADRYPKLLPTSDRSKKVQKGFEVFRRYCVSCHSINHEGGAKGPELNVPKSVTETMPEDRLRQWITDPRSLQSESLMPSFKANADFSEEKLDNLILYLKERAAHKMP